ncbi:MAG: DEAD/DEAH box helicase [Clostridia bacterium]|nr:DEAD/DEAH box helicase [Clostridia bacterium]
MIDRVLEALKTLRCPFSPDEYDLHKAACEALAFAGISCTHEAVIGKRCRIDILCGDIGLELKRGKPTKAVLVKQLTRYAETGRLKHLIVVSEQNVALPENIAGVQIHAVCLFKLWGVADAIGGTPADHVMDHAQKALFAAQQALLDVSPEQPVHAADYEDDEVPAYMQDVPQSARCYGTLSYNHRRKCWTVRGEACVTELCKRLFPGSDSGKRGEARFTAHRRIVGDLNWLMLRYPLEIAPRDRERWERALDDARAYAAERNRMLEAPKQQKAPEGMFLGTLRPFQEAGLAWLVYTKRGLLADEMGLGKTLQALCALCAVRAFPAMIVVPPHLVRNWQSEIGRFIRIDGQTPRIHVIKGLTPYKLPEADIYIMHYLLLRGWKEILPNVPFKAVVFDEIQELRRSGTEKYSAASLLAESCERVMGLSGTPIYNQGGEIWNVINILDYHFLGDFESFTREWCYGYGNNIVIKPDLLGEHLRREGLMLRRTKAEVLPELPEKRRLVQEIDTDDKLYKKLMSPVLEKLKLLRGGDLTPSARALLTDQICQGERRATGEAKAAYVCQFVRALLENDEKVLLFAHHHAVMDIYKDELKAFSPVFITGRESGAQKEQSVDAFMQDKTNLCCVSLRAAAGLNLQKATCVVFGELDWSPAVHSQAEDRAHRIGQKDSLLCYYLVSPGGSDADIQEALGLKVSQFMGLMGEKGQDAYLMQSDADFARRYVEKLLGRTNAPEV